ncbi:MAG: sigma factor-like helix-turn-helix DNA-binding protein [Patescibacteria group bacterium]|jgi:hypothetical protein
MSKANNSVNNHSILDKIIASKEDQEKQEFAPDEIISQLLRNITPKEADVLVRRHGLKGSKKETLEAIGQAYHVTRERVRQIENLAIKKIKQNLKHLELIRPIEHVLTTVLDEHGGMMSETHLLEELFALNPTFNNKPSVLFLLSELAEARFDKVEANEHFVRSWKIKTADLDFVMTAINMLAEVITNHGTPMELAHILERLQSHNFYQAQAQRINHKVVVAYLEVSRKIEKNPFGEYGLTHWGSIIPKRMNDKIFLVLKKAEKPMHFVDIAKNITEIFKKEAYPPTVHNELILNDNYVLVGRGIYALTEWGYQRGVVADVIAQILKEYGKPMKREDIVARLMKQRLVKRNTIHLALTDKKRFQRLPDGRYTVK